MALNKFCFLSSFDVSKFFSGTPDTTTKNKKNKKTYCFPYMACLKVTYRPHKEINTINQMFLLYWAPLKSYFNNNLPQPLWQVIWIKRRTGLYL